MSVKFRNLSWKQLKKLADLAAQRGATEPRWNIAGVRSRLDALAAAWIRRLETRRDNLSKMKSGPCGLARSNSLFVV
jgi:hypothetical protein